ncbi:MAG: hypothetical protein IRY99_01230 [Isosphaeraceae bacterium]|nr:hypothetical protein [Isosphaeraceae bacterium]
MRWVGIDEAGYGPNLGPLVMTAVVAEGPADRPPDVWGDLPATVARAGSRDDRLWIDDSKRIYQAGKGLERLEAGCLAALAASGRALPTTLGGLLAVLGAGSLREAELALWLDEGDDPIVPRPSAQALVDRTLALRPFEAGPWRLIAVRSLVVGPARFNATMGPSGSKAVAHFDTFARLLRWLWGLASDGGTTCIRADKHGGRHFYADPLSGAFPDARIDRGPEGPELSRYTIHDATRRLELRLQPRADAVDGLVALASMISKALRERWMEVFNTYWLARIPALKPTAGYPGDATRFRAAIEPACRALGLDPTLWWRAK